MMMKTKQAIRDELRKGAVLIQDQIKSDPDEIRLVDELVVDGDAFATEWNNGSRRVTGRYEPV